jgi:polyisoprenyl-teichoic acid--peptidoglycan teichoic acid transferase
MSDDRRPDPDESASQAGKTRRRVPPVEVGAPRSLPEVIGLTVLGAILPGTALLAAGRRKLALTVLAGTACVVGGLTYALATRQRDLLHWALEPQALTVVAVLLPVVGLAWTAVVVGGYRALRPTTLTARQRMAGNAVVVVLALLIIAPLGIGTRYALVQRSLIEDVFARSDSKSVTRPSNATRKDPWSGQDRVNVLLLGSDAGPDRIGTRTDTNIVASIDTRTGATVLFSLPRNLQNIPFPADSPLAKAYPDGRFAGPGDQLEWMLDAIYMNVPAQHPGLLASDNPGADATKLAISGALGLRIDYFVLVNLQGFRELIDALGGITVNVNYRVPKGGQEDAGLLPGGWIEPGPDQHLDGFDALWFARSRYGADDYQRMERQRCVIKAIIDQADPMRVLVRYEALARTTKHIVLTDIPSALLPAFVDLSLLVKNAKNVTSVAFTDDLILSSNPDYDMIHERVRKAVQESAAGHKVGESVADSLDAACAYDPNGSRSSS